MDENNLHYSPDFSRAQDYELWSRCLRHCRLANIGEVLLRYRLHDMSVGSLEPRVQYESADRIRSQWLERLGLHPTSHELEIHRRLSTGDIEADLTFLDSADLWLNKLREANAACSVFANNEFLQELSYRWFLTCNRATRVGPSVLSKYLGSSLTRHFSGTRVEVLALAIKSVLRRSGR